MLFPRRNDAVIAAEVHESKETQQSVVVSIEIAILEGHVLGFPEGIDKLLALIMATHHRGSSRRGHQTDAVTQLAETTGSEDLITLRQGTILAELIHKGIHALAVHEILERLAIPALPFTIGTAPLIVERNIHRYAPGVVTEAIVTVARRRLRCPTLLLALWTTREAESLHFRTIKLTLVTIQGRLLVYTLVEELTTLLSALIPKVATAVVSPLGPDLVEGRDMIGRISVTIAEAVRGEGDELRLRIDEVHHLFLRLLLLVVGLLTTTEATETATLRRVLLGLDAVQDALGLSLVIDARVIAPTVRGEDEGGNEV